MQWPRKCTVRPPSLGGCILQRVITVSHARVTFWMQTISYLEAGTGPLYMQSRLGKCTPLRREKVFRQALACLMKQHTPLLRLLLTEELWQPRPAWLLNSRGGTLCVSNQRSRSRSTQPHCCLSSLEKLLETPCRLIQLSDDASASCTGLLACCGAWPLERRWDRWCSLLTQPHGLSYAPATFVIASHFQVWILSQCNFPHCVALGLALLTCLFAGMHFSQSFGLRRLALLCLALLQLPGGGTSATLGVALHTLSQQQMRKLVEGLRAGRRLRGSKRHSSCSSSAARPELHGAPSLPPGMSLHSRRLLAQVTQAAAVRRTSVCAAALGRRGKLGGRGVHGERVHDLVRR